MECLSFSIRPLLFILFLTLFLLFVHSHSLSRRPNTLPVFRQVHLQNLIIPLKPQHLYRRQNVLTINSFTLLVLTLLTRLTCNERNKLRDTLLYSLLRILSYFRILGQCLLHNTTNVSYRQKTRIVRRISNSPQNYLSPGFYPSYISQQIGLLIKSNINRAQIILPINLYTIMSRS